MQNLLAKNASEGVDTLLRISPYYRVTAFYCADFEPLALSPLTDNPFRLITVRKDMHLEMYPFCLEVDWCLG